MLRPFKFTVIEESSPFFSFKYFCCKYLIFGVVKSWGVRNLGEGSKYLGEGSKYADKIHLFLTPTGKFDHRKIAPYKSREVTAGMAGLNITRCNTRNNNTDNIIIQSTEVIRINNLVISSKEL